MANLGRKFNCYSCHTKFYDLGRAVPLCPKCGADQRNAEEESVAPVSRSRRAVVVEEAVEETDFAEESETPSAELDDADIEDDDTVTESEPADEEEEDY